MERILCSCRRYIRIARMTRAISSATTSRRKARSRQRFSRVCSIGIGTLTPSSSAAICLSLAQTLVAQASCLWGQQASRLLNLSVSSAASQTPDKMSGGPTGKMPCYCTSEPRDLTPGDHDVPPFHLGGQDMYAISPDGQEVACTSNIESEAGPALSKRPARTTKFSSCRLQVERLGKFPLVPAAMRRRSIRRMENTSPGARKPARASKPINGGCSCKIDNQEQRARSTKSFDELRRELRWTSNPTR